jgi:hypothetical protein
LRRHPGLNAKYFYDNLGIIPQNVNFAIKSSYLKNLLSMLSNGEEIINRSPRILGINMEDQIDKLDPLIVQVQVY